MSGLGYLEVQEDCTFKGPIDKFIPTPLKQELFKLADLEKEDTYEIAFNYFRRNLEELKKLINN